MNATIRSAALLFVSLATVSPALHAQAQWTAPTPEELSMTSIKEAPGAPAVILFKEELADDALHMQSFYYRVKVLTEGGKDYANVNLKYFTGGEAGLSLDSVSGRTIQPDGTIVPFTDKPYVKTIINVEGNKEKALIFSLPAVQVGSILEYRYKLHIEEHYFIHPEWDVQTDLFTRKAHFMWKPTDRDLSSGDGSSSSSVAWTPVLPAQFKVVETTIPAQQTGDGGHTKLELNVADISPLPKEQFMPPRRSVSYRVMFYYTSFRTSQEYWKETGKRWVKEQEHFITHGSATDAAVKSIVADGDTPEQKLRKLYAAVMTYENTDFTRERSSSEEKAQGLKEIKSTDDVVNRKRGTGDQIAATFIALARTAGFNANLMGVADRSQRYFLKEYLSLGQLDDLIAIVTVDGKEVFLDPGQRYCAYGQLSWKHGYSAGLRETDGGGTAIASTPSIPYPKEHVTRVADLKLDDQGVATGTVIMGYTGDTALAWRQDLLRGDGTSVNHSMRNNLERLLPGGMEVTVDKIDNLTDPDKPVVVTYKVKGAIGSSTGKRLLIPANLFEVNTKPRFPEPKREMAVDMHHPSYVQDAVRIVLPDSMVIESTPTPQMEKLATSAIFDIKSKAAGNSITMYRNVTMGETIFPADEYAGLRGFYGKLEAKDQETLVLTRATTAKPAAGGN